MKMIKYLAAALIALALSGCAVYPAYPVYGSVIIDSRPVYAPPVYGHHHHHGYYQQPWQVPRRPP